MVNQVVSGGPADTADLRVGDQLVKIGKYDVRSSIDYLRYLYALADSRQLALTIKRGGRTISMSARPMPRSEGTVLLGIGARVTQLDADRAARTVRAATEAFYRGSSYRRVPMFDSVVRLDEVMPGSSADTTGLEKGDLILGVIVRGRFGDREVPITTLTDLARLIEEQRGEKIRLIILRGDKDLVGTLTITGTAARRR